MCSFTWNTDRGVHLYIGKIVDVGQEDYGVKYYEVDNELRRLQREVVRTPHASLYERGRVSKGRWVPSRVG